jgi:hypothetical protein
MRLLIIVTIVSLIPATSAIAQEAGLPPSPRQSKKMQVTNPSSQSEEKQPSDSVKQAGKKTQRTGVGKKTSE